MKIYNVLKRIRRAVVIFLFKHSNNNFRIFVWRKMGVTIGENCRLSCFTFSPEAYLIEIGDHVVIAKNVYLITHEGSITVFHHENPHLDLFGRITIGNNCFIGMNSLILPKTTIGNNCIIGAGSVVRGTIPDDSVVVGNPARIVMSTADYKKRVYDNSALYDYKKVNAKEKKRLLLEKIPSKNK